MSPPRVSLSSKEPLKAESDKLTFEKGDDVGFPAVIVVETEHRARNFRRQARRRQCKRIICGITLAITVAVAALLALTIVNILRRHHRKSWKLKTSSGLPTNVDVDSEKQLIRAFPDYNEQQQTATVEILHDFSRHLVAYKDVYNDTCYIDRLDETFQEGYVRWESYETGNKDSLALKVISQPIEVEVLHHIGDVHIFEHCENAVSYWVMEIEEREVTTETRVFYV